MDDTLTSRLDALQTQQNLKSRPEAIRRLLNERDAGASSIVAPATFDLVFRDQRPVCITGPPRSGKTSTVRDILESFEGNIFVVDVTGKVENVQGLSQDHVVEGHVDDLQEDAENSANKVDPEP